MKNGAVRGLVFVPYPYTGSGSSYTPIAIARQFPGAGHEVTTYIPSLRARPPGDLDYRSWLPVWLPRPLRGGRFHRFAYPAMVARLLSQVRRFGPGCPVWLWPNAELETVRALKDAGAFIMREMINTHQVTVRTILENEARLSGLRGPMPVTEASILAEDTELALVDRVVSPSDGVDRSLIEQGVPEAKIYRSHFGWDPARFSGYTSSASPNARFTALFVGDITMRKGVHLALEAWRAAQIEGEFRLVGRISPEMQTPLAEAIASGGVCHIPFTSDLSQHYRESDVFLFPTLEEGAPLVCYEAAAFGLPIITGPMGTSRFVEDGVNGVVVDPHDIDALSAALRLLAHDRERLDSLSTAIRAAAETHRWEDAARSRVALLRHDLNSPASIRQTRAVHRSIRDA